MTTLVSTGQITIVDNNDAKPITAFITSSAPLQQTYTKDESSVMYVPNWTNTPITLTAKVYVGSTVDTAATLTNKKWSNDLSTSIGTSTTFTVNVNLTEAAPAKIYYFEGDFTDLATGLSSHIICQIQITLVKTGTNAVYLQIRGQNVIEQSTGSTKNTVTLIADLIRAAGVDNTGISYKWYQSPHTASDQIDGNLPSVATNYGFQDTAAVLQGSIIGAIGVVKTTAAGISTPITLTNIPDATFVDLKAITIGEGAVANISVFKVEAKDSDGTIFQQFFTVYDISDLYDTKLISTSGDKLQNGVGNTTIYPRLFYGSIRVANVTGWTFDWTFYDRDGVQGAFIDTTRTAVAGGRNITANTTGASAVFTYDGTAITFNGGDIIKCVKPSGVAVFYEVLSGSGNTVTIRTPVTTWVSYATPSSSTDFVAGKLYVCSTSKSTSGGVVETAAQITVTGDEIDAKGSIFCSSNRP